MTTAIAKRESDENKQLTALRQIAAQQTPQKEIRTRKGRGGQVFKYTDGAYVIRTLNEGFGWDWDFEADNEEVINFNGVPFEVRCRGRLTVRLNGQAVTKVQYGSQAIEFIKDKEGNIIAPVTIGDAYKGAATDAMKKCASLLGVALDLYDSDYKAEKYAEPEPVRNVKLDGAQPQPAPSGPRQELRALNRKLGYTDAQLVKWLTNKYGLTPGLTLGVAMDSLSDGELSQAIDLFNQKVEEAKQ